MTSASEQTSASKREPGYYWVHFKEHWGIALWNGIEWFIQDEDGYHYYLNDEVIPDVFDEIDERRIERPLDTEPSRFDIVKAMADQLGVGQPDELYKAPKCPKCGSDKIAMFDDNDDHCLKCGSIFSAVISNSNTVAQLRAEVESARLELEKLSKFIWDATPPLNRTQIGNTVDGILKLLKNGKA